MSIEENDEAIESQENDEMQPPIEDTEVDETTDDPDVGDVGDVDDEVEESDEESAYKPNLNYRVLDQEHEMDERVAKLIKNEDDEAYFRDIFERAKGLDPVRADRQALREENTNLRGVEETRQSAVRQLQEFVASGDLKPFMKSWGIDTKKLAQYVLAESEIEQLPDHQRQAYERNEQARMASYDLQQQNYQLQQQNEQYQTNQLRMSVDQTLNSPEFAEHVQAYDAVKGEGAFRAQLAERGNYHWHTSQGQVVAPEHLAREVIERNYMSQPQQQQRPPRQRVMERGNKPTLPNIRGSGGSPIKQQMTSIAQLRAKAESFAK